MSDSPINHRRSSCIVECVEGRDGVGKADSVLSEVRLRLFSDPNRTSFSVYTEIILHRETGHSLR